MLCESTSQFHSLRKQCMPQKISEQLIPHSFAPFGNNACHQKISEQQMEYTPSNQLIICFASLSKVSETLIVRNGSS